MAGIVYTKLVESLANLGIDVSKKQSSNVKTLATKNKSSATKVGLLAAERDTGGNFGTVLDIFRKEAQFIEGMNDVERMNFLNNIMDYKEFGGKPIKVSGGISSTEEMAKFKNTQLELKKTLEDLNSTAKTMKDDADAGLKSAEKDLKDFFETGGQPLKAKSDKYLGGSMHEEGQLRTAIRTFLKNEYKNGRIKLDKDDQFRIMEYSPMMEDDPIKVFKKIYGDEAYKKAGTFPGVFEKGENFNHYESIFKENMGEDLLKVKDKKYVGDGTLTLTKQEEVVTPTPDDDVNFATGGRASFVGGKAVDELVAMLVKKEPMEAMKEINKIIGKKGKYKNLTQKDIDRIVDQTNDWIFQRDPDNLYVGDRDIDNKKRLLTDDEIRDYEAELGDSETWMMDGTVGEAEKALADSNEYMAAMKKEYDAASPAERAEVIGKDDVLERDLFKQKNEPDTQIFKDSEGGIKGITMGGDDEFKKAMSEAMEEGMRESENMKRLGLDPTKMEDTLKYDQMKEAGQMEKNITGLSDMSEAEALRQKYPGISDDLVNKILIDDNPQRKAEIIGTLDEAFRMMEKGKGADEVLEIFKNTSRTKNSTGGRAGYYGGGQATVEPDLSDIGHGSDALMARTRITAPGSQATTSTGLNYLLGEDNDNTRVPFNNGLKVDAPNPRILELMLNEKMSYEDAVKEFEKRQKQQPYIDERMGTGPGPILEAAEGGRIGFAGGGADMGTVSGDTRKATAKSVSVSPSGQVTTSKTEGPEGPDDKGSPQQNLNHLVAMHNYQNPQPQKSKFKNMADTVQEINYLKNVYKMDPYGLAIGYGMKKYGQPIIEKFGKPLLDKIKDLRSEADIEEDGIMQMAELNDLQKKMLSGPQKQLKDIIGISNEEILQNISPFNTEETPATIEDVNKFYAAKGGIAGLRPGYAGGGGIDIARRGFLKFLGGTAAGVAALKAGLVKILGKESGAISKKVIDEVIIEGGSGAPAWLQPLVNKALREGTDISKQAIKDGQVVKSLDTPTGKVDVYYDTRSGEIDIDYIGGNTALGESVNMRYTPGIADEGTKGVKPADEFEATEAIPQLDSSSGNFSGSHQTAEMGENVTSDVKGLYSDTSELAELGGQKTLTKDIVKTIKKKKILKEMDDNPDQFALDNAPEYDY